MNAVMHLIRDEKGIQHAEEGLLLALVAVAMTTAAIALQGGIAGVFSTAVSKMG